MSNRTYNVSRGGRKAVISMPDGALERAQAGSQRDQTKIVMEFKWATKARIWINFGELTITETAASRSAPQGCTCECAYCKLGGGLHCHGDTRGCNE